MIHPLFHTCHSQRGGFSWTGVWLTGVHMGYTHRFREDVHPVHRLQLRHPQGAGRRRRGESQGEGDDQGQRLRGRGWRYNIDQSRSSKGIDLQPSNMDQILRCSLFFDLLLVPNAKDIFDCTRLPRLQILQPLFHPSLQFPRHHLIRMPLEEPFLQPPPEIPE